MDSWQSVWNSGQLLVVLVAALITLLSLALWTRNRWIKKRLSFSLFLTAVLLGLCLFNLYSEDGVSWSTEKILLQLLTVAVLLNSTVSLTLNPFFGDGVSDKWPAIVQDALVLGGVLVFGLFVAEVREQFVALGLASTVVFGFALKDTLGNLFSGLALQSEKPFHVGDWVRVAQKEGRVLEATWRATKIRTKSGNFVIIPNSVISQDSITNYSKPSPVMRMERIVGMGFEVHPNAFKKVALETFADIPDILKDPKPDVLTHEYGEDRIRYRCRFWINNFGRSEPITDGFTTLLFYRLQRAGLPLPLSGRDVRITERRDEDEAAVIDPRRAFVDKVDLFSGLDAEIKASIAESMEPVTFASGEPIIHQGAEGDSMFFIYLGTVRIVLEKEGAAQELAQLQPGQFFGEMALLTGEARSATANAVGDVEAFVLHKDRFRDILLDHPEVAEQISEVMSRRKVALDETSAELASRTATPKTIKRTFLGRIQKFFGLK